jgi:hypothetical protein
MKIVRDAKELADAIGLQPGDTVQIVTPPANWTKPQGAPTTQEEWEGLRYCTREELLSLGCGSWNDHGLMLFPGEWYNAIPLGYELRCINGETSAHRPYPRFPNGEIDWDAARDEEFTDDDIRFGCLAYGVMAAQ